LGDDLLEGLGSDDHFDGGGGRDALFGGAGRDFLTDGDTSGASDADQLDGGPGDADVASYAYRTHGVDVDLALATGGEPGESDSLAGIESLTGSRASDRIRGTDAVESIFGRKGDDEIEGLGGNDQIEAGSGDDRVDGGTGDDSIDGESGVDAVACGEGQDTVFGTVKSELMELPCEFVGVRPELGTLGPVLPAHAARVSRRAVWLEGRCLLDQDEEFVPCRGVFKLHEATGRRRLFARATFALDRPRAVRVRLTPLGRRLTRRPGGVLTDVSYRTGVKPGDGWPGKADWAIQLGGAL
jgi:Ca2+-binding RTX toxin-like protein